jgi:TRAP-type C4-dicarboxylate transport system substrate-binding protein
MKRISRLVAVAAVSGAALWTTASQAQVVLRYSNYIPPAHILRVAVFDPWIADVEKVTNGRVKVEMLPKVVGTVAGQYDVVRDGLADVAVMVPSYAPGKFDLAEIVEIPFMGDRAETISPAFNDFYTKNFLRYNEFAGTHVLSIFSNTPPTAFTKKSLSLKSADDFKGAKMRTPSASMAQSVTLLGGVPVIKPVTEIYEMVSSGLVDGAFFPALDHKSFKLTQALPRATVLPGGISCSAIAFLINEAKWQSISPADREAITKISGAAMARLAGKAYDEASREALAELAKTGGSVETASPAMMADVKQRVLPVEQGWIERARKKGVADPAAALATLRAGIAAEKP